MTTPATQAARAALYNELTAIFPGSASCAVDHTSASGAAGDLPFTKAELSQVVMRHAACMREQLHGEPVMDMLGLRPYTFSGDD